MIDEVTSTVTALVLTFSKSERIKKLVQTRAGRIRMAYSPTLVTEARYFAELWKLADSSRSGLIGGQGAVQFFLLSGLPPQLLREVRAYLWTHDRHLGLTLFASLPFL